MDPVLADEAIAPLQSDRNVYGVAVYGPGGRRLAGHGKFPATMVSGDPVKLIDDRVLLTLRDIHDRRGRCRATSISPCPPNTSIRRDFAPRSFRP